MSETNVIEEIPEFGDAVQPGSTASNLMSAFVNVERARTAGERLIMLLVAVVVILLVEFGLRISNTPDFVFPKPSAVAATLSTDFRGLYWQPLLATLKTFFLGLAIGSTIGLVLAALVTQKPFLARLIAPYIIILVTTPMIALIPFLMLKFGFGMTPRVIAVALASGPMVMINSATGFSRTNAALVALGNSYGATTFQTFRWIRFPLALPMIIVGYMIGSIFGLLTAVGAEMIGGGAGLGNRLVFFSSLVQMPEFGAVLVIISALGLTIYSTFTAINNRWANWQA